MRHTLRFASCLILCGALWLGTGNRAGAQNSGLDITAGLGLPELINVGLNYRAGLVEVGGSAGFLFLGENNVFSAGGDLYYHFSGYNQYNQPRPWYLRAGAMYLRDEGDDLIHKYIYLNGRIGRDFTLSQRFVLKMDAGVMVQMHHEEIQKESYDPLFDSLNVNLPVLPSIGVKILYRL